MCSSLSISYTFVEFTLMCSCHDCTKDRSPANNLPTIEAEVSLHLGSSLHKSTVPRFKLVIFGLRESGAGTRK